MTWQGFCNRAEESPLDGGISISFVRLSAGEKVGLQPTKRVR